MPPFFDGTSLFIRANDDTLFSVPLADLLGKYRLPDQQQKGSLLGDNLMRALDQAKQMDGLKNAFLGDGNVISLSYDDEIIGKHKYSDNSGM